MGIILKFGAVWFEACNFYLWFIDLEIYGTENCVESLYKIKVGRKLF